MNDFPILTLKDLVFGPIGNDDISVLREIFEDSATRKFLPELYSIVQTDEELKQLIWTFDNLLLNRNGVLWGIRKGKIMMGIVAIIDIPTSPTILYAMHPQHRSQGYMKESVRAIVRFVTENGWCHYVQSEVYNENIVSLNILKEAGFEITGQSEKKIFEI